MENGATIRQKQICKETVTPVYITLITKLFPTILWPSMAPQWRWSMSNSSATEWWLLGVFASLVHFKYKRRKRSWNQFFGIRNVSCGIFFWSRLGLGIRIIEIGSRLDDKVVAAYLSIYRRCCAKRANLKILMKGLTDFMHLNAFCKKGQSAGPKLHKLFSE